MGQASLRRLGVELSACQESTHEAGKASNLHHDNPDNPRT